MKLLMEKWTKYLKEDDEDTDGGYVDVEIFDLDREPTDEESLNRRVKIIRPNGEPISIITIFNELNDEAGGEWEGWKNSEPELDGKIEFVYKAIWMGILDWAEMKGWKARRKDL